MIERSPRATWDLDAATVVVLATAMVLAIVWTGAQLATFVATGRGVHADVGDAFTALIRLPHHVTDPRHAWPDPAADVLPGPVAYWAGTLATGVAAGAIAALGVRVLGGTRVGTAPRRRLGVDTRARLARTRDLRPLLVRGPVPGRLIVGTVNGRLVATEVRQATRTRTAVPRRRSIRAGDRSAVCVIGPARCGKTTNTISGILEWSGPAILSSVKTDILGATLASRSRVGDVRVFDPTMSTGQPTATWTPLRAAATVTGAQKAARALVDAAPRDGADNIGFFQAMAKQLLWPLLYAAAVSGRTMADVVRWVLTQEQLLDEDNGAVLAALDRQLTSSDPVQRNDARLALEAVTAIWELDDRTRGSTFATCQTMIDPWQDPAVAAASEGCDIDLDWLLSGNNTLYLCAPTHEQQRLAPVFGGLLGDLLQQAYERASRTNSPLQSTLLVMDEAGNTPTRWLPSVASTCASIGILLVTIWQSKAQLDAAYGTLADSVLTNHGTKIIFNGVSDPATLTYASRLLGDEEIHQRATSNDTLGGHRRSITESATRLPLVPGDVLRQMRPGEALLVHGTLRPAHLRSRARM